MIMMSHFHHWQGAYFSNASDTVCLETQSHHLSEQYLCCSCTDSEYSNNFWWFMVSFQNILKSWPVDAVRCFTDVCENKYDWWCPAVTYSVRWKYISISFTIMFKHLFIVLLLMILLYVAIITSFFTASCQSGMAWLKILWPVENYGL